MFTLMNLKTAKALGFRKGEWVLLTDSGWYAKLLSDVHTKTPVCFVLGFAYEAGSVYSNTLAKLSPDMQRELEKKHAERVKSFKAPLVLDNK